VDEYLTIEEVARLLFDTKLTVRILLRTGELPCTQIDRYVLIKYQDVEDYRERCTITPNPESD
jgi:excisionase family DNA binding protein